MTDRTKPRLVLYGIGQYGCHIARFAVKKGWPIVAAFNHAGSKVGQDLGRLAGLERDIGVIVQDCDTASYEGLDADIGVVTVANRLADNFPAYVRLLNAGLNVLCHGSEAYYPYGCDAQLAEKINALARKNGVTFSGSGIWDASRIWSGILAAGPCTELRSLFHSSITDVQRFGLGAIQLCGIGLSVEEFQHRMSGANAVMTTYKTIPEHVLAALGYKIRDASVRAEPVISDQSLPCPALGREIAAGEVAGTRVVAEVSTHEGVTAQAHIETRLFCEGEIEHMFWSVDGLPRTRVRTERDDSGLASATSLFNRIPDVIAAPSGIVLLSQLGPLKHTALR